MDDSNIIVETVDTHTAGEPTRILALRRAVGRQPHENITQLRNWFSRNYDGVRRLLMQEPRGHNNMFGAVLVPSSLPRSDFGLFYLHPNGYLDSCGHATIGVVTALYDLEWFSDPQPIRLETPSGIIHAIPELSNGTVDSVALRGISTALINQTHDRFEILSGQTTAPITYVQAGNTFALIEATDFDLDLQSENIDDLRKLALVVRDQVNETVELTDPINSCPVSVDIVVFYQRLDKVVQTVAVFGDGSVDRSPCGTGICALLTLFYEQDKLSIGEKLLFRSPIDTYFIGEISLSEIDNSKSTPAPVVHGKAHITGFHTFVRTPGDPISGFTLG